MRVSQDKGAPEGAPLTQNVRLFFHAAEDGYPLPRAQAFFHALVLRDYLLFRKAYRFRHVPERFALFDGIDAYAAKLRRLLLTYLHMRYPAKLSVFVKIRRYAQTHADLYFAFAAHAGDDVAHRHARAHEVGIFLGYPAEDVFGYMRDPGGCIFSGAWKVYSEPEKKRALFARYKKCSGCIVRRLACGETLAEIFR